MDSKFLLLALSEQNLEDVNLFEKQKEYKALRLRDGTLSLPKQHFLEFAATHRRNTIRVKQFSLWKNLIIQKCYVYAVKHTFAMIERAISTNSAAKDWTVEL